MTEPLLYASFNKRFNAYGWDALVILGLSLLVGASHAMAQTAPEIQTLIDAGMLPAGSNMQSLLQSLMVGGNLFTFENMAMPLLLSAIYNIAFVAGEWQATPGKRFCGIKVVMADGSKPTLIQSAVRHVASGVSVAIFWLGFLPVLWTKEKTALHDMICDTRVVRVVLTPQP